MLLIAFAGSYVGRLVPGRINQGQFRGIVLTLIFLTGIVSLLQFSASHPAADSAPE